MFVFFFFSVFSYQLLSVLRSLVKGQDSRYHEVLPDSRRSLDFSLLLYHHKSSTGTSQSIVSSQFLLYQVCKSKKKKTKKKNKGVSKYCIISVFLHSEQSGAKPSQGVVLLQGVSFKALYYYRLSLYPRQSGARPEPRTTWSLVAAFCWCLLVFQVSYYMHFLSSDRWWLVKLLIISIFS